MGRQKQNLGKQNEAATSETGVVTYRTVLRTLKSKAAKIVVKSADQTVTYSPVEMLTGEVRYEKLLVDSDELTGLTKTIGDLEEKFTLKTEGAGSQSESEQKDPEVIKLEMQQASESARCYMREKDNTEASLRAAELKVKQNATQLLALRNGLASNQEEVDVLNKTLNELKKPKKEGKMTAETRELLAEYNASKKELRDSKREIENSMRLLRGEVRQHTTLRDGYQEEVDSLKAQLEMVEKRLNEEQSTMKISMGDLQAVYSSKKKKDKANRSISKIERRLKEARAFLVRREKGMVVIGVRQYAG